MATTRLPRYVLKKRNAKGETTYFWNRPTWAKPPAERHGRVCPVRSAALGTDLPDAIRRADNLNETLDEWREGADERIVKGSVKWLFAWYREQERFKKNSYRTRQDYRAVMDALDAHPMKVGTLGQRMAGAIDASAADKLYDRMKPRGARRAAYMMQICRLVWAWALRHSGSTGVKSNPFAGMGIKSTPAKGNRATSRREYDLYRTTAREMGHQAMATAAALAFELCQREWDVFGFVDPDRSDRGIKWSDYQPGVMITLTQSKTGRLVEIPLSVEEDGETISLYPELEEELARSAAHRSNEHDLIVFDKRTGQPFTLDRQQKLHKMIRDKAALPKEMTFTGFRHGGITEIGTSGEADVRPISGHATLAVTGIYNKANQEKARRIARVRRKHVSDDYTVVK